MMRRVLMPRRLVHRGGMLALVLLLGLLVVACSGDSAVTTSAGDASDSTTGSESDEQINLTVWASRDFYIPPDQFASFEAEHPNISVTFDVKSDDTSLQEMQVMVDAGQPVPDIVMDDPHLLSAYQSLGLIQPIDDLHDRWEQEDPEGFAKLLPTAFEQVTVDDQVYGLSAFMTFDQIYYNIPWFEEAQVELPFESLNDFFDAAVALKEARPDGIPLAVQAMAGEGVTSLKSMLRTAGAPFEGATPDLTSEGGVFVIDMYMRMQQQGLIPPDAIAWGEPEARGSFLAGTSAMLFDSLGTGKDFVEAENFEYGEDWSLTVVPRSRTGETEDGAWAAGAKQWMVTAGTEHRYEASLLLRYLAETDNLVESMTQGAVPPRQTEALDDPRVLDVMPFLSQELKDALIAAGPLPTTAEAGEVDVILEQMFGEIVVGTSESAEDLAARYQALLDEL